MKDKHTPGSWEYESFPATDGEDEFVYILGNDGTTEIIFWHAPTDEQKANARLIASSPCLLAALRALLDARRDRAAIEWAWEAAEEAVARAEGAPCNG